MAKTSKTKIREAILANRGGHEKTSDAGIMTVWNSLNDETRKQYLGALEAHKTEAHKTVEKKGQSSKGTEAQSK